MKNRLSRLPSALVASFIVVGLSAPFTSCFAQEAAPPAVETGKEAKAPREVAQEQTVFLNTRSMKFHKADCQFRKLCTKCVPSTRPEAKAKGAEACKVCGG